MQNVPISLILILALLCAFPAAAAEAQLDSPAAADQQQPSEAGMEADSQVNAEEAAGQDADAGTYPDLKYFTAPALFICPVHVPREYDPDKSYPLVIGLHGYASSPERFHTLYFAFDDPQYIYAAPQAPYPLPMGDSLGFSWFLTDTRDEPISDSLRLSEQYVLEVIGQVKAAYRVSDVYLLGFSQGSCLAYIVGLRHPDLIKGIVCFDAWFDPDWFEEREDLSAAAASLRVMIAHATDDPAVAFERGVEARDQLEWLGYKVTFLEFAGGHTLTAGALKQVEAWIESPPGP
jgi:phospholipase/carboxylesterase